MLFWREIVVVIFCNGEGLDGTDGTHDLCRLEDSDVDILLTSLQPEKTFRERVPGFTKICVRFDMRSENTVDGRNPAPPGIYKTL